MTLKLKRKELKFHLKNSVHKWCLFY
jgi:hypothetical protein